MLYIKINKTIYPATISGRVSDNEWDNRESKAITLEMSYEMAVKTFVDGLAWSIIQQNEIDGEILDSYSDWHKDMFGYRPRSTDKDW